MDAIIFRPFQAGDETAFRELNEAWISQHFVIEPKDSESLNDPVGHVLQPGGELVMAILGDRAVGCCAMLPMPDNTFEIAKMAVAEDFRGRGVGKDLLAHMVERARQIGARRLYLETNSKLQNAIHVYESQGFTHLPPDRVPKSPYARANLYMEMLLQGE